MSILTTDLEVTEEVGTTKTYKLSDDKIQGSVDGSDALEQAIYKMLNTEQYEHSIYSFSYGIETDSLIGQDPVYVRIELKRRITECLLQDERITGVDNFDFTVSGDNVLCTFDVGSIYGDLAIMKEVNI